MQNYYDLQEIFANSTATGQFSRSGEDMISENNFHDPKKIDLNSNVENEKLEDIESLSGDETETPNKKVKRKEKETGSMSSKGKKVKRTTGEGIIDALSAMAAAVNSFIEHKKEEANHAEKPINVIDALNAIPNLEEDLYMEACDLLEDGQKAKIFVALDVDKRKAWLTRKLYSNA